MAYDEKFKRKVIEFKDSGHTFKEVHEAFGVDSQRYYVWKKQPDETGTFTNHYPAEHQGKIDPGKPAELVKEHPDWELSRFAQVFDVWPQSIHKRFAKMKITRKKNVYLQRKFGRSRNGIFERC